MMRDKVDFVMLLLCVAAVGQWLIWKEDLTAAFAVVAFYVFNVIRRLGIYSDIANGNLD